MGNWDKAKVSAIVGILLSALLALAAVFGYDVKVIQPREARPAPALRVEAGRRSSVTGFDDLSVASVTATGAVAAGGAVSRPAAGGVGGRDAAAGVEGDHADGRADRGAGDSALCAVVDRRGLHDAGGAGGERPGAVPVRR